MPEQSIQIVPYDPVWPTLAGAAVRDLRETLPDVLPEIERIGSTAVPGLAAKPIIDLMAAAEDYLRARPRDAARYAELKRALAATGMDAGDYARAKTDLVQELTDRARGELGLPPVPVWEK